jgi:hypothetical protein
MPSYGDNAVTLVNLKKGQDMMEIQGESTHQHGSISKVSTSRLERVLPCA